MDAAKEQKDRSEFEATLLDAVPHVRAFARSLTRNREAAFVRCSRGPLR